MSEPGWGGEDDGISLASTNVLQQENGKSLTKQKKSRASSFWFADAFPSSLYKARAAVYTDSHVQVTRKGNKPAATHQLTPATHRSVQ